MILSQDNKWVLAFGMLAVMMVGMAIIGGTRSYSPVPYWDMWDGYLDFFIRISNGDIAAWWSQHNEHRIVLSRVLFWIDLTWFDGLSRFLIVIHYLLMSIAFLFFHITLKEQLSSESDIFLRRILSLMILIILFSWIQKTNYTQGFQSPFILAHLLPFIAFYLQHRSFVNGASSKGYFFLAWLTGVMSLGTMANGVLVLPLMTLLALILRMGWQRLFVLAISAIISTTLYFYDYHSITGHGSLTDVLIDNPTGVLQYLLLYIGGPFYYLTGEGSLLVAQLAGFFLITSAAFFTWKSLKNISVSSLQLALITYLLYIGGTALGTAGGRLSLGLEQALSSRYQTPALMVWAALIVLYAPAIAREVNKGSNRVLAALIFVPLLLLPHQLKVFCSQQNFLFEKDIAALALELGINDRAQISSIYPSVERALLIAKKSDELDISIFGQSNVKDASKLIGQFSRARSPVQCMGSLDEVNSIEGNLEFVKIRGWAYQNEVNEVPKIIYLLDENRQIIGHALTGQVRPDVGVAVDSKAMESGFKGYSLSKQLGKSVIFRSYQPDCELEVKTSPLTFSVKDEEFYASAATVRQKSGSGNS